MCVCLVRESVCRMKHLQRELFNWLIENQRQRVENENEEQRSARLGRLTDNQAQRLADENEEKRTVRLDGPANN